MSTRGIYHFTDSNGTYSVYKHYDNYPEGAAEHMLNMFFKAWPLPRFEADECAAAFVAVNKKAPGDVRLISAEFAEMGEEYEYHIFPAKNGQIILKAFHGDEQFFYGRLKDFIKDQMDARHHGTINELFKGDVEGAAELNPDETKAESDATVKAVFDLLEETFEKIKALKTV